MNSQPEAQWTEEASDSYRGLATIAVPQRATQIATLLALLPFARHERLRVLELGCGEGMLAHAVLTAFPQAELLALEGSASMRALAQTRLARFGVRMHVESFDLLAEHWLHFAQDVDLVISSLCVHHLDATGKQRLFAQLARRLTRRGVLLLADLVEPGCAAALSLFADAWDHNAAAEALAHTGSSALFEQFQTQEWNHYRFPDTVDQPSGLFEQLQWLKAAGFATADCFWMAAGHAIYGGFMSEAVQQTAGITFPAALQIAETALARP